MPSRRKSSSCSATDILICPDYCSHYRYNQLFTAEEYCNQKNISVTFLFNAQTVNNIPSVAHRFLSYIECKPILLFGRYCIFQINLLTSIFRLRPKYCIVWGEITRIDTWIVLIAHALGLISTKPILWTHGLTGRENALLLKIRLLYLDLAHSLLLYSNTRREMLRHRIASIKLRVIGNYVGDPFSPLAPLNREKRDSCNKKLNLIYVGRLSKQKQLNIIYSVLEFIQDTFLELSVTIVSPDIKSDKTSFYPSAVLHELVASYDQALLASYLNEADFGICPDNIGLFALTCLRAGVPVITHLSHQHHGPESSMLHAGLNCLPLPYPPSIDDVLHILPLALHAKNNSCFRPQAIVDSIPPEYKPAYIKSSIIALIDDLFADSE